VDGLDELIPFLTRLQEGRVRPHGIVEMSACRGSCLGGPVAFARESSLAERREALMSLQENDLQAPAARVASHRGVRGAPVEASAAAIEEVLRALGKTEPEQEYNCGACGYHSCREKAAAVVNGRAELQMCLPYMRARAESMANLVLAATPSAVVVVDKEFNVREWNDAAERMCGVTADAARGRAVSQWLPEVDFARALHGENLPQAERIVLKSGKVAEVTYSVVREGELVMGVYSDITELEAREAAFKAVRAETLEKAQAVINKQMRVAQEIASLLGETTAESKMLLLKLMKVVDNHE
jgi:PAS domain S-box-containing protein